jgi:hypothetical protein
MTLPDNSRPTSTMRNRSGIWGQANPNGNNHHFSFSNTQIDRLPPETPNQFAESVKKRQLTVCSRMLDGQTCVFEQSLGLNSNGDKVRKFGLHRSMSKDSLKEKNKPSDDLTNDLKSLKLHDTGLRENTQRCTLSEVIRAERTEYRTYDFVFRMPALEYRARPGQISTLPCG